MDDIKPSSRKYPFVKFESQRDLGNDLLRVENVSKTIDGVKILDNINFTIRPGEKAAILSRSDLAQTTMMQILAGTLKPDTGTVKYGQTVITSSLPRDLDANFNNEELSILDWLRQYATKEQNDNTFYADFWVRCSFQEMIFKTDQSFVRGRKSVLHAVQDDA